MKLISLCLLYLFAFYQSALWNIYDSKFFMAATFFCYGIIAYDLYLTTTCKFKQEKP